MNIGDLMQRQSLPLEKKIQKSIIEIEKFYQQHDGNVYISTGGSDSAVVRWLSRQSLETENIECVCVASVEPKGNIRHNLKRGDTLLKSVVSKRDIITRYGYPLIGKEVSRKIYQYIHTKNEWVKDRKLNGYIGRNGKIVYESRIPLKYQCLIYAPFEFSDECCNGMKKKPLKQFERKTKKVPITGEKAVDSYMRRRAYLDHGCINNSGNRHKCTPIAFWTEEDKMECIRRFNIEVSDEYGDIVDNDGILEFTKTDRTGCYICGFGLMKDLNRYKDLKKTEPNIYKEMMNGGKWIRKPIYRWVKFRPSSIPIWSNLYFVPSDEGYGFKFCLDYLSNALNLEKLY